MKTEDVRIMWLFVFFDLPVGTKSERGEATRFRNFLKSDGYMMIQFSVYARVCLGEEAVDKHLSRVTKNLPKKGSVRTLQVTERQYARMKLLIGEYKKMKNPRLNKWFSSEFRSGKRTKCRGVS
jgi:CRISPR-associated protein Cas2